MRTLVNNSSLRVGVLAGSLDGGGAEFVARTWANYLARSGHFVTFISVAAEGDKSLLHSRVNTVFIGERHNHASKVFKLRRALEDGRFHAVVSAQMYPNLLLQVASAGLKGPRPKVILSEHNLVSLGMPDATPVHRAKVAVARLTYRFADHVVAVSHPVAGELVSWFRVPGKKCTVVANPATDKVSLTNSEVRLSQGEKGIQLILPCRQVVQKQPHLAVLTAAVLKKRGINASVVAFGGGPMSGELNKLAADKGVVIEQRGWVHRWFDHVGPGSIVLLPSKREGFGNVLVEAAAVGIPSVAFSGALGVADAVLPGITGELVADDSPEAFADGVLRARELNPLDAHRWLLRFSADASGETLEGVIARCVGEIEGTSSA